MAWAFLGLSILQWLVLGIGGSGVYYVIEAAANLIYWQNDNHPFLFQLGRVLRLIVGAFLILTAWELWILLRL